MKCKRVAILGSVGVPASYGGFETLVENLVRFHSASPLPCELTVYCSSHAYPNRKERYLSARLKYVPLNANGVQSILYDTASLFSAIRNRHDVILLLGVSGAISLPFIRFFSSARIVTNIDGIEWRRAKWRGLARKFLHFSERLAVKFSHAVISDNDAIAAYVSASYHVDSAVIAYGGDHAMAVDSVALAGYDLPAGYALSICRIEPENNLHVVLSAFAKLSSCALVIVGNWDNSEYGCALRKQFGAHGNIFMIDPIYDLGKLKTLRKGMSIYIHGHSAGGTNPSLVEAMHFRKPVLAFDCDFNRATTENRALFFKNADDLALLVEGMTPAVSERVGSEMVEIAERRYTWAVVGREYFCLLGAAVPDKYSP